MPGGHGFSDDLLLVGLGDLCDDLVQNHEPESGQPAEQPEMACVEKIDQNTCVRYDNYPYRRNQH